MKKETILRRLTERAGLYGEALPNCPLVELCGDDRMLIEHHKCVLAYCDTSIDIKMPYGILNILGQGLCFICVETERLLIRGRVDSITLTRGRP